MSTPNLFIQNPLVFICSSNKKTKQNCRLSSPELIHPDYKSNLTRGEKPSTPCLNHSESPRCCSVQTHFLFSKHSVEFAALLNCLPQHSIGLHFSELLFWPDEEWPDASPIVNYYNFTSLPTVYVYFVNITFNSIQLFLNQFPSDPYFHRKHATVAQI